MGLGMEEWRSFNNRDSGIRAHDNLIQTICGALGSAASFFVASDAIGIGRGSYGERPGERRGNGAIIASRIQSKMNSPGRMRATLRWTRGCVNSDRVQVSDRVGAKFFETSRHRVERRFESGAECWMRTTATLRPLSGGYGKNRASFLRLRHTQHFVTRQIKKGD